MLTTRVHRTKEEPVRIKMSQRKLTKLTQNENIITTIKGQRVTISNNQATSIQSNMHAVTKYQKEIRRRVEKILKVIMVIKIMNEIRTEIQEFEPK